MSARPLGLVAEQLAKREGAVRGLSAGAKHQAFPRIYAQPLPGPNTAEGFAIERRVLKDEINRLRADLSIVRLELATLKIVSAPLPQPEEPATQPPPKVVMAAFCQALLRVGHELNGAPYTIDDIKSPRRSKPMTRPRHVAMWLVRRLCKQCSLPTIGQHFGQRDHTSIMHGCNRAPLWMEQAPLLNAAALIVLATFESKGDPA